MTLLARREPGGTGTGPAVLPQRRPIRRRRRVVLATAAGLLAGAAAVAAWAATEGLSAYRAAQRGEANLLAFQHAIQEGDLVAARRHLADAHHDLDHARAAARPVLAARRVAWVGRAPRDAGKLLDSAQELADAAGDVLRLQRQLAGPALVRGGRVDVTRVRAMQPAVASLRGHLEQADAALAAVRGDGPFGGRLGPLRDSARARLAPALGPVRLAELGVRALSGALEAPHLYLLATLNYAELHGGGGAPLSIATLEVRDGGFTVVTRGQVSDFAETRALIPFVAHPDDPWQRHVHRQKFVSANLSPDFATDGEEMLRLYQGHFGIRPDGVIALDPTAIAAVLRLTGPVSAARAGRVEAGNLVQKLLLDSYLNSSDTPAAIQARHHQNDALMDAMFRRLLQVSPTLPQLQGLLGVAREGHLRVFADDPLVQEVLRRAGLAGELTPFTGDQVGVYTFNLNASKVDIWQRRAVDQQVTMHPDGSAAIVRTVTVTNDIRRPCPDPDPGQGYQTCLSDPYLMTAFPIQAHSVSMTVDDRGRQAPGGTRVNWRLNEAGRQVWQARVHLEAGESARLVLRYSLGPTLLPDGYRLRWDGQPMAQDPALRVTVRPAAGVPLHGTGWRRRDGRLVRDLRLVGTGDLHLISGSGRP